MYVHQRLEAKGYPVAIVSGITSFCAVAARMNMSLVERSEPLHVIPASYQIAEALKLPGTKVLMKAGKQMKYVQEQVKDFGKNAVMIENCGMPDEKIYASGKRSRKRRLLFADYCQGGRKRMIHFVGAGSGAPGLITVRGQKFLQRPM